MANVPDQIIGLVLKLSEVRHGDPTTIEVSKYVRAEIHRAEEDGKAHYITNRGSSNEKLAGIPIQATNMPKLLVRFGFAHGGPDYRELEDQG